MSVYEESKQLVAIMGIVGLLSSCFLIGLAVALGTGSVMQGCAMAAAAMSACALCAGVLALSSL